MIARIIYDETGFPISQMQGSDLYTPIGIPYLDVEIPEDKYIIGIDITVNPNVPIFVDFPKSETQLLKEENIDIKLALAELAEIVAGGAI